MANVLLVVILLKCFTEKYYSVELFDLRTPPEIVQWFREGLNVDDGMIVTINQRLYYADEAAIIRHYYINSLVGRANRLLFSRRRINRLLHSIMKPDGLLSWLFCERRKSTVHPVRPIEGHSPIENCIV